MQLNPSDLRALIRSTLPAELQSPAAEELLMATCAQESLMGHYRRQVDGPALGIFQMEPATYQDIWTNFLAYHQGLLRWAVAPPAEQMVLDDELALCMARVQYRRVPEALPEANDLRGLWMYYKAYYNTPLGDATIDQFYSRYKQLVGGLAT